MGCPQKNGKLYSTSSLAMLQEITDTREIARSKAKSAHGSMRDIGNALREKMVCTKALVG